MSSTTTTTKEPKEPLAGSREERELDRYKRVEVPYRDLQPGDIVRLFDGPFSDAVVVHAYSQDGMDIVKLLRPYATTGETLMSHGVIPYIGVEYFTASAMQVGSQKTILRLQKGDVKR